MENSQKFKYNNKSLNPCILEISLEAFAGVGECDNPLV
jgi:hypothetical protein